MYDLTFLGKEQALTAGYAAALTGLHFSRYRILLTLKYLHPCKQCTTAKDGGSAGHAGAVTCPSCSL